MILASVASRFKSTGAIWASPIFSTDEALLWAML
jgi:hypothetical protein